MRGLLLTCLVLGGCCGQPKIIVRTETIEVPVPTVVAVPVELSADCPPSPLPEKLTIGAIFDRLASVETALARCRRQLTQIRALH